MPGIVAENKKFRQTGINSGKSEIRSNVPRAFFANIGRNALRPPINGDILCRAREAFLSPPKRKSARGKIGNSSFPWKA